MIRWRGKKNVLNLYISAKHPEIIKLSGAVDLKADSNIDVKEFTMLLSGASDVLLKRVRSKIVKLYASGACDIDADMFEAENVIIDNSGSCELSTFLNAEWLELDISGSSDFNLAGRADYVDIDASGAGNIDAFELAAQTLKYDASGSGYCGITVEKTIDADISGAASLFYRGNAQITSMDVSGMGSVKKR